MDAPAAALVLLLLARPAAAQDADDYGKRAAQALRACTVSARVGPQETPLSLPAADFLLDHPDLSAAIARNHGLAPYRVVMRAPRQSWADDGDGTRGLIVLIEHEGARRTYYAEGAHSSALFPTIRAAAVVRLELNARPPSGLPPDVVSSFDVCVRMRNPVVSGLVKILRPFLQKTIVRKFSKAFFVAHGIGESLAKDPEPIIAEILAYPDLSDEERAAARKIFRP